MTTSSSLSKGYKIRFVWVVSFLHGVNHESWFLGFAGRKNNHRKKTSIDTGTSSMLKSDGTLDATPRAKEVVPPNVVDDTVEKENLSPVVTTNANNS
ncbi:hypothetical protein Tco_0324392 [Tanacetum coccineum]